MPSGSWDLVTKRDDRLVHLILYVDDLLLMGKRTVDIVEVKKPLMEKYKLKNFGVVQR